MSNEGQIMVKNRMGKGRIDLRELKRDAGSRIVMLVVDGLGGYPHPDTGLSELETASLPNLDSIAGESACGLTIPIAPGITPGSGPGHMALFGYMPTRHRVGRGVMEALGIGLDLAEGDVAARGNFCAADGDGRLLDRRAGRIPSERSDELVALLDGIDVPGHRVSVHAVRDHRFVAVFHGIGTGSDVTDTDPGLDGHMPLESRPIDPDSEELANAVNAFVASAHEALKGKEAQAVALRGISSPPVLPSFPERFGLRPAAIAAYPMYRGLARLAGMDVLSTGRDFASELDTLKAAYEEAEHDFFFLHYKPADAAGEDGDFDGKVAALEALDTALPQVLALDPDVLVIAGDHSTPAVFGGHSWHPVPLAIRSKLTKGDGAAAFTEPSMASGSIGTVKAMSVMTLAMAHAGRLKKYGP
jgi:2,3-bisphosphoglycerate-independent phosphoglycerate mutase